MARKKVSKKREVEINIDALMDWAKNKWVLLCVLALFVLALYYRAQSYRFNYLLAIDPFYIYRMSSYAVTHSLHLPHLDVLRYYPTYIDPHTEYTGAYILPAIIFLFLTKVLHLSLEFFSFAKMYPSVMGALFVAPMYYIGKEMHSKLAGLFAAFFYATSTASMYRTAAGFFEKEPQSGLFMLISFYFFVRSARTGSLTSAVISGVSMAIFGTIWGGVRQLYFAYALFMIALLLVNRVNENVAKTYITVFLSGMLPIPLIMNTMTVKNPILLLNAFIVMVVIAMQVIEKRGFVKKESMDFVMPSLLIAGVIFIMIGGIFSTTLANFMISMKRFAFYQQGVIESTVAENVIPTWGDFVRSLDLFYAKKSVPMLSGLFDLFPLWLLAFVGIVLFGVRSVYLRKDPKVSQMAFMVLVLLLVSLLGYYKFLKVQGSPEAQAVFLFSFLAAMLMVARVRPLNTLYLGMILVAMLGFLSRIRLMFVLGILFSLFAAYLLAELVRSASKSKYLRKKREELGIINVFDIGIGFLITFVLVANMINANIVSKGLGPSFNSNWDQAMKFLNESTEPNATVLSWWDFGYWFETMGNRSSNLDGGNNFASRNIPTAQFFTGMMNESQQKFFLEMMGTDYVLVDVSMVGKYAAMSKIANFGNKVDAYMTFTFDPNRRYVQGNSTILVYTAGPYSIWVPVNNDGALAGRIMFVGPRGEAYIRYLCTSSQIIDLGAKEDEATIDGCVVVAGNVALLASKEIMNSVFHNLWFMDGKDIAYLSKVFDNGEVKIYRVNHSIIPDRSRDELVKWWKKYNWKGLIVYNGTSHVEQKVDMSVFQ